MSVSYTLLSVFYLAGGVFIFLLGLTILRSGRSSSPTSATALMLFFAGVGPILSATSIILQSTLKEDAIVYRSMVENFEYLWEFYFPSLLLFSLTYPREHRVAPSFVLMGLILFAPYIVHLVTIMAGNNFSKTFADLSKSLPLGREVSLGERTIPLGGIGNVMSAIFATLVKLHKQLFLLVNIVYATIALYLLSRSHRLHVNPRITGQLRTVLIGVTVSIVGYVLAKIISLRSSVASPDLSLALINFSLVAGGGSVAYAIVKQEFLGIKYVARKSTLYGAAAVLFAVVYLTVVKPVSDFFGQYSMVSKEAFETGFIILAIIAFQPILFRTEELLEQLLLKGRDDLQTKFKGLGSAISNVSTEEELEERLQQGFREILDASTVGLHLDSDEPRFQRLVPVLGPISDPVTRHELMRLGEKGQLPGLADTEDIRRSRLLTKKRSKKGLATARSLAGDDEVLLPILKERTFVGYVTLGEKTYGLKYSTEELALLSVFANQIGVALDNIRLLRENVEKKLIEEELQIARRIQSRLLPSDSPMISGYQLSASTIPSRYVGGDFYDFELVDGDNLVVVVADVSGKGIPASLLMATLHAAVNSNEDARKKPAAMLRRINRLLYHRTSPEEFATVFYGVVDLKTGEMRYANAGHEFPYVVSHDGLDQLAESGIVLGCLDGFPYEEKTCLIPSGGSLILYTDGVTDAETTTGESFGEARLRDTLESNGNRSSIDLCAEILDKVRAFSSEGEYQDDLTLVVLKRD
jgi:serine phosphatase RsbU (regulator of sigma subunit)